MDFLLVPLTAKFAFISPTLLVMSCRFLRSFQSRSFLPTTDYAVRRVPVWYGGFDQDPERASTTALTFSNAMRTFYSFIYRPTERRHAKPMVRLLTLSTGLTFTHDVAPIFGPYLFAPLTRAVLVIADRFKALQSGNLNYYLALIGALLIVILALSLY